MDTSHKFSFTKWLRSKIGLALIIFLMIASFFLIAEHTAHLFGLLPYALLLLSILLFLFLSRGQNIGRTQNGKPEAKDTK